MAFWVDPFQLRIWTGLQSFYKFTRIHQLDLVSPRWQGDTSFCCTASTQPAVSIQSQKFYMESITSATVPDSLATLKSLAALESFMSWSRNPAPTPQPEVKHQPMLNSLAIHQNRRQTEPSLHAMAALSSGYPDYQTALHFRSPSLSSINILGATVAS